MAGGIPLALLALHRLVDAPSPRRGVALGLALAAAGAGLCLLRDLRRDDGRLRRAVSRREPRRCGATRATGSPSRLPPPSRFSSSFRSSCRTSSAARGGLRAIARRCAAVFGDVAELSGDAGARARRRARAGAASRLGNRRGDVPRHPGDRLRRGRRRRWACARGGTPGTDPGSGNRVDVRLARGCSRSGRRSGPARDSTR